MRNHALFFLVAIFVTLSPHAVAENKQASPSSEEVVQKYINYLKDGDISSLDSLFFKIPLLEENEDDWLKLLKKVSIKTANEQLAWEVLCSKEMVETAVVIINQNMKQGKPHRDPDGVILIKESNNWLLLPDTLPVGIEENVKNALSKQQQEERQILRLWGKKEIRKLTWAKGNNGEYSATCN